MEAQLSEDRGGYRRFSMAGRVFGAHEARWIFEHGRDVPPGHHVHHTCWNRACVNIAHLQLLTKEEHRKIHAPKFCRNAHRYTPENTGIDSRGHRYCRRCRREQQRAYREQKRQGRETWPRSRLLAPMFHEGRSAQRLAHLWLDAHKEGKVRPYVQSWGDREFGMIRRILRQVEVDDVEQVMRAVILDWTSFTPYAVDYFGASKPPKYPTVFYLCARNHFEAAVCWYREDYLPAQARRVEQEGRRACKIEGRALEKLRSRSFDEVYREKLDEAVTPGSEVHRYVSDFVWEGMPLEMELQILHQRAVAEAKRELGQQHGVQDREMTQAEREAYYVEITQGD